MDFSGISALLGSVKTATEIAKFIKESDLSIEKAETKLKLAELISALADVKLEAAEIQQSLVERDDRIRELEKAAKVDAALVWREPCYWLTSADGIDEPFCQHCYDKESKLARLHTDGQGMYSCRVCEKKFRTRERSESDSSAFRDANQRRVFSRGLP
jgi:hypothetical protein